MREPNLKKWKSFLNKLKTPKHEVNIGLIGKYNELPDAYKSIYESFIHAGAKNSCKVNVIPVHSEHLEGGDKDLKKVFSGLNGILVAPGFGERGIAGKINAIRYARENQFPFFGICLGMQCAVVEFAQNVLGLDAASQEVDPSIEHPVIHLMEEQQNIKEKGGTMRLGAYPCNLAKDSLAHKAYGKRSISERHRHRYEFNSAYLEQFEANGMKASGMYDEKNLVEIVEVEGHPWFMGVQFHPELKSTVEEPHKIFVSFVKAALEHKEK